MGTTAQKLQAIQNSKAAIKSAIEAKGVSDVGDVLADYATKIGQISGGGSSGDPRYEVSQQGALSRKSFAVNWFNNVTSILDNGLQYAYYRSSVTSASFPSVTSVGNNGLYNAFYGCTSLTSIDLSKVTSVGEYGMQYAFQGCTSLTSVDLSSLTSITNQYGLNSAFQGCTSLTSVDLSSLTSIAGLDATYVMSSAFYGCTSLTSVDLSSLSSVGYYGLSSTFQGCTSLTSVDLSSLSSVGYYGLSSTFQGCTSLRNVLLTKLSSSSSAFNNTFNGCTHLELVDFSQATAVPALSNVNAFNNTNNYYRIVVPNALYNQWIAATNWSNPSIVTHIEKAIKGLVFTAESANSTISLDAVGTPTSIDIEYSTDGGTTFSPYTVGTTVTLSNVNDVVMFRAGSTGQTALADDSSNYHKFTMTGSISIEDNISYLLNKNAVPATTALADYAFYGLFKGCASLQNAPELPWTTMGEGCYGHMFEGCTALTDAQDLPSTSLDDYCYEGMFKGCTSITTAPKLPATTLSTGCYNEMFKNCSSLNNITLGYRGNFSTTYFNDWVYGVASEGNFMYQGADTTRGTSAIPAGWSIAIDWKTKPLTFKARQAGSTVSMTRTSSAPSISLQYSTDNGTTWNTFTVGTTTVTLANIGDEVQFKATTTNNRTSDTYTQNYNAFVITGSVDAMGNVNSLLSSNFTTVTNVPLSGDGGMGGLFWGTTGLVDASKLMFPATTVGNFGYNHTFYGCSDMTKAPEIFATNVGTRYGFGSLYDGCSSLTEIKIHYTGSFGGERTSGWVNGVASSGTLYYNGSDTTRGTNAIPTNWTVSTFST